MAAAQAASAGRGRGTTFEQMLMCPAVHHAGRTRHDPPVLAHMGRMPGSLPRTPARPAESLIVVIEESSSKRPRG